MVGKHLAAACWLLCASSGALAWSNHTLVTWQALSAMPELAVRRVTVEPLEAFLADQDQALDALLAKEENWAREHVAEYPARPQALAWRAGEPAASAKARFLAALRVNPDLPLPLFLQRAPDEAAGADALPWMAVTTLRSSPTIAATPYKKISAGQSVPVTDVFASASDEPDYGMDLGLWEDNGTEYGKRYGFGKQPFGNPALEFSSQSAFHIGLYHESPIVYAAAPFLKRTYPEYRIHLFQTLARQALKSGHDYWAWRFAGWAVHYVGDLTQPYHSRVLPGVGLARMLWINALSKIGFETPKNHAITLVSNRHLAFEHYQYYRMKEALGASRLNDTLLRSLRETSADDAQPPFADTSPRTVVSEESQALADRLDAILEVSLPEKYTRDPTYEVGAEAVETNMWEVAQKSPATAQKALEQAAGELLGNFGRHTRAFVRSLLESR